MAFKRTGTKAPASRGLDYSLGADILNRVKAAGQSEQKLVNFGQGIEAVASNVLEKVKGFQAEKEKEKKEQEEAGKAFDNCFESLGNRGSWTTPELYSQFTDLEKGYQDQYNKLVESGDKDGAAKILSMQKNRSSQLESWKQSVENTQDTYSEDLYAKNMNADDLHIISEINSQKNAKIKYVTEEGAEPGQGMEDMVFEITMPNGDKRDITLNEYNEITERNLAPKEMQASFLDTTTSINEGAAKNTTYEFEIGGPTYQKAYDANANGINRNNFKTMFNNNVIGGNSTFEEDFMNHPEFKFDSLPKDQGLKTTDKLKGLDKDNDGSITNEELIEISDSDKMLIIEEMKKDENYEIAKHYLAQYFTLVQKQNADQTRSLYETERTEANKNAKYNKQ